MHTNFGMHFQKRLKHKPEKILTQKQHKQNHVLDKNLWPITYKQ